MIPLPGRSRGPNMRVAQARRHPGKVTTSACGAFAQLARGRSLWYVRSEKLPKRPFICFISATQDTESLQQGASGSFSSKWCFFGDYFSAIIYLGVHLLRPEILEKMLLAPLLRRRRRMMEQFDQHTHHTSRFMHPVSRTSREPLNARDDAYPLPQAQPQGCQRCRHTIGRRRRPRQ